MICFEVLVNGERLCLAGGEDLKTLTTLLSWAVSDDSDGGTAQLTASGATSNLQTVRFGVREELSAGDVITIRVVEADTADEGTPHEMLTDGMKTAINDMLARFKSEWGAESGS